MKISIIVPVYNAEKVLHYCVDSILNQTYKDYELILVNDGSTDNSKSICDKYSVENDNVIVIHTENGGVSKARNKGIEQAKGEYICFVDSDDYVSERYLKELVETKDRYPDYDNIWCGFQTVSDYNGSNTNLNLASKEEIVSKYNRSEIMTLHEKWLSQMPWNKLFISSIIKQNHIWFSEDLSLGEDLLFNLEYLDYTNGKILVINQSLYYYLQTGNESLDNKFYPDLFEIYHRMYSNMDGYLGKWIIDKNGMEKYYNSVFFSFEKIFRNTMDKSNPMSFFQKIKYNNSIMKCEELRIARKNMSYSINRLYKLCYTTNCYFGIFLLDKMGLNGVMVNKDLIKKIYYKLKLDRMSGRVLSVFSKWFGKPILILDEHETTNKIVNEKLSVSRFGDGELHIAQEGCSIGFQRADKGLQKRLRDILIREFNSAEICVCLPSCMNCISWMTEEAQTVWSDDLKYNRFAWKKMINKKNVYGDTQFTRPYMDYKDKSKANQRFNNIKRIWNQKDILIVEGEKSKLGIGNDLFDNTLSIKRILCPAENAFDKYSTILNAVLKQKKSDLVLIALGPTATVLAYDLSGYGYQAIDIGHIDIEYEWSIKGAVDKESIIGKYTNESNNSNLNGVKTVDTTYQSQIVERIV